MSPISQAWTLAASDLGLSVVAPVDLESEGINVRFDALIREFGSPRGVVVAPLGRVSGDMRLVAKQLGIFVSELALDAYGAYSRGPFIEALADWGWHGPEASRPTWLAHD
jgi:hypothetical protein